VHWSDGQTLGDLAALSATMTECPAVLVLTMRTSGDAIDEPWRTVAGAPHALIDLGPLSAGEANVMAESFPGAESHVAKRCIARAAGNPLFLEQLLNNAEDNEGTGVPGSVRSLVQARLDRLHPEDKAVAQVASVLGQFFEKDAVDHLLDGAGSALESLATGLLLRRQGAGFIFHHALIRDAIYDGLLKSSRRGLHRRAAQWYGERDAVLRAEHLDRAEDREAALAYCEAARSQASLYRHESALRLVKRGLALADKPSDRVELECLRGTIHHDLNDMTTALAAFETAFELAATDAERCRAWIGRATVKRVIDDLDGAWTDLDCAAAAAAAQGLLREEARIHFLRGNLCFPRGDIDGCVREHGHSLALAREAGDPEQEAAALGGLGDSEYMRGRMTSARDAFSRWELKSRRFEGDAIALRAELHRVAGRRREALDDIGRALAISRETGMNYLGASHLGVLALATDDVRIFESALVQGESLLGARAVSHNHFRFRRDAIDACIDRGLWDRAAHHAAALEEYASREPSPFSTFFVARARALVGYAKGDRSTLSLAELERLRREGRKFGFLYALPAIDAAL
jgi:tetratricopeptide (TPR) repeat protein